MIMKRKMIAATVFVCVLLWAISGFAMTPEQVIKLKKAGVSDETIQLMMKQEEAAANKDPYATMGTKEVTDKDGNTVIIYTTGNNAPTAADAEEAKNAEKAWEMLRSMTIKKQ
jgi:hypothetical protein